MNSLTLGIASRNDMHEADPHTPLQRLQENIKYVSNYIGNNIEYHIVDWGSDNRISKYLKVPNNMKVKIYYVPKSITEKIPSAFPEVLCHNLIMRNITTDFYGRADQDTIVSKKFFKWFNETKFSNDMWGWSVRRNLIRERINDFEEDSLYNDDPMFGDCFRCAVGILMLSKKLVQETRGYNENNIFWNHMEHEFIGRLLTHKKHGYRNIGLLLDAPFFHIDHIKTVNGTRKLNDCLSDKDILNLPLQANDENWGLKLFQEIEEHRINL